MPVKIKEIAGFRTYFGADDDHQVCDWLRVVDQHGFDGAVQHSHPQLAQFAFILEQLLMAKRVIN